MGGGQVSETAKFVKINTNGGRERKSFQDPHTSGDDFFLKVIMFLMFLHFKFCNKIIDKQTYITTRTINS